MAKYYVQSGSVRTIVQAESSRRAALWAVHQAMQQVLPLEGDQANAMFSESGSTDETVAVLGTQIKVSERGFESSDAIEIVTLEIVNEWNQLVMTLDRLERMLHVAR